MPVSIKPTRLLPGADPFFIFYYEAKCLDAKLRFSERVVAGVVVEIVPDVDVEVAKRCIFGASLFGPEPSSSSHTPASLLLLWSKMVWKAAQTVANLPSFGPVGPLGFSLLGAVDSSRQAPSPRVDVLVKNSATEFEQFLRLSFLASGKASPSGTTFNRALSISFGHVWR